MLLHQLLVNKTCKRTIIKQCLHLYNHGFTTFIWSWLITRKEVLGLKDKLGPFLTHDELKWSLQVPIEIECLRFSILQILNQWKK
jgi:hypothetical protein